MMTDEQSSSMSTLRREEQQLCVHQSHRAASDNGGIVTGVPDIYHARSFTGPVETTGIYRLLGAIDESS